MRFWVIFSVLLAVTALPGLNASDRAAAQGAERTPPLTSMDEVIEAVSASLAATDNRYVDLDALAGAGWIASRVIGDPARMTINTYNKRGSDADIMIIRDARNPGSLQCSAVGRFPDKGSFAELDGRLETMFGKTADETSA